MIYFAAYLTFNLALGLAFSYRRQNGERLRAIYREAPWHFILMTALLETPLFVAAMVVRTLTKPPRQG